MKEKMPVLPLREPVGEPDVQEERENPKPKRDFLDFLHERKSTLENMISYMNGRDAVALADVAKKDRLIAQLKIVDEKIEWANGKIERGEWKHGGELPPEDAESLMGEFGDIPDFSEAEPEFSRGFGHEEGGIGKPVPRRMSRGDGRVMPVPDLSESDQKVGFGHPRAGKVDSDFMPQD
ncbi:MAG: hypothetical protein HGB18_04480 [Candidatus Moranbacteria bacterium]|nr:hypothetical protein [Candidatus Moranbacteria bacterium]